jgi:hypothetical protein
MENLDLGQFSQLAIMAFLVESLIQTLKPLYAKDKGWNKHALFSLLVSIAVTVLTQLDVFAQVGLGIPVPFVGSVLTGVIASRGSNVFHDVFKFVQNQANNSESQPTGGVG